MLYCSNVSSMPKTHFQIQARETSYSNQALYGLLYLGKQIGVCLGSGIKLMKVNAKVQTSVFLHTSTTALHHGLLLGQIVPTSNISFTCAWTTSTIRGGILQSLSLKGSPSTTLISCFTKSVQPKIPGSREKMSWYSATRSWTATWFLPDHLSRPDKSCCWKSNSSAQPSP